MSSTASTSSPAPGRRRSDGPTWRAFLKPGWFLAAVAILVFSYFAFTFLAPWQLGKNHDIGERNERIERAFQTDPVPARDLFRPDGSIDPGSEWRRVTLTGHYLPEDEAVLRMRPVEGAPAIQALTPFVTDFGQTILVNRGWQEAKGAQVPDFAAAPSGPVSVEAVARLDEPAPERAPLEEEGLTQVYGINTGYVGEATGVRLAKDFVQISVADQPGGLIAIPIPKLDRGSHLSYGLQWIAFGVMAPAGLGYFIWAEIRERRRVAEEQEELAEAAGAEASADAASAPEPAARDGRPPLAAEPEGTGQPTAKKGKLSGLLWDEDLEAPPPGSVHRERSRSVVDRYGGSRGGEFAKLARRTEERF